MNLSVCVDKKKNSYLLVNICDMFELIVYTYYWDMFFVDVYLTKFNRIGTVYVSG